jgi:hypothetical protein
VWGSKGPRDETTMNQKLGSTLAMNALVRNYFD